MSDDQDGCVGECFFWYRPTRVVPDQRPLNGPVCVCVHAAANDRYQTARLTATTGLLLPAHAGTDRRTDGHHTVS